MDFKRTIFCTLMLTGLSPLVPIQANPLRCEDENASAKAKVNVTDCRLSLELPNETNREFADVRRNIYDASIRLKSEVKHNKNISCSFKLDVNGSVSELRILKSSGNKTVDDDVMTLIRAAEPFNSRMNAQRFVVEFPFYPSGALRPPDVKLLP